MSLLLTEIEILPGFLPETIEMLDGEEVSFTLPPEIRRVLHTPERITVSACADQYRVVTAVDAAPGPWDSSRVPHTIEPMDDYASPWVKEIWLCWPERAAKTNVMLNCLAWTKLYDSGNVFWLDPAEDDAGKNLKTKIIPMFRESEKLSGCLSPRADDTGKSLIAFQDGTYLFPAHSNSARSMSNFFGLHNFGNEVDKYPPMTGPEADPITLIRKRGRDVPGSRFMFSSTPAGRHIYKGTFACRKVKQRYSRCPHCKELILMDDGHLVIPDDATYEQVENEDIAVGYACNACGAVWDEEDRRESFLTGRWVVTKGEDKHRPRTIGYHASALPFPMIPLSEYCGKKLRAEQGDIAAKIAYVNGYQVKDYEPEAIGVVEPEQLLKFRSDLPRNLVPPGTARLCLLVDTQQSSFYYEVWAYGYAPEISMHMVAHDIIGNYSDIEGMLQEIYLDHEQRNFRISNGLQDSGGTRRGYEKHSRTVEVYEFCSRNRAIVPLKGIAGKNGDMISYKQVETYPGSNKPIKGGLKRVNIRVDFFKDELERRLTYETDNPHALSFHSGIDVAFAKHYTGETKDEHGEWRHTNRNQRIDYYDCTIYALALREMMKRSIPMRPTETQPAQRRILSKGVRHE